MNTSHQSPHTAAGVGIAGVLQEVASGSRRCSAFRCISESLNPTFRVVLGAGVSSTPQTCRSLPPPFTTVPQEATDRDSLSKPEAMTACDTTYLHNRAKKGRERVSVLSVLLKVSRAPIRFSCPCSGYR